MNSGVENPQFLCVLRAILRALGGAENVENNRPTEEPTTTGTKDTKNNKHELWG